MTDSTCRTCFGSGHALALTIKSKHLAVATSLNARGMCQGHAYSKSMSSRQALNPTIIESIRFSYTDVTLEGVQWQTGLLSVHNDARLATTLRLSLLTIYFLLLSFSSAAEMLSPRTQYVCTAALDAIACSAKIICLQKKVISFEMACNQRQDCYPSHNSFIITRVWRAGSGIF